MPAEVIRVVALKRRQHVSIGSSSMYRSMVEGLASEDRRRLAGIERRFRLSVGTNSDVGVPDPLIRAFNESRFECLGGSIRYFYKDDSNLILLEFELKRGNGGGSTNDKRNTRPHWRDCHGRVGHGGTKS
jgi:hypothetical protein